MAKQDKFKDLLGNMNNHLQTKDSNTPIQKTIPVTSTKKIEETKFTVHIPSQLMDQIKDIGHRDKKKIKSIFVEALEDYIIKNKIK